MTEIVRTSNTDIIFMYVYFAMTILFARQSTY